MCGRFSISKEQDEIQDALALDDWADAEAHAPSWNVAPTQSVPVVLGQNGRRSVHPMRWGLIPSWSKDDKFGGRLINARAETLTEKPSFRSLVDRRHCAVLGRPGDQSLELIEKSCGPLGLPRRGAVAECRETRVEDR